MYEIFHLVHGMGVDPTTQPAIFDLLEIPDLYI